MKESAKTCRHGGISAKAGAKGGGKQMSAIISVRRCRVQLDAIIGAHKRILGDAKLEVCSGSTMSACRHKTTCEDQFFQ